MGERVFCAGRAWTTLLHGLGASDYSLAMPSQKFSGLAALRQLQMADKRRGNRTIKCDQRSALNSARTQRSI
jgi:hypothetical protein